MEDDQHDQELQQIKDWLQREHPVLLEEYGKELNLIDDKVDVLFDVVVKEGWSAVTALKVVLRLATRIYTSHPRYAGLSAEDSFAVTTWVITRLRTEFVPYGAAILSAMQVGLSMFMNAEKGVKLKRQKDDDGSN